MKSELVKLKGLELMEVQFNGDPIMVVRMKDDGKTYVGIKWVCDGLGLTDGQMKNERIKLQEDLVLKQGGRNLVLPTRGGNQQSQCIELDFLPLWLAKISITPKMISNNQNLVGKLIEYQLKAKDVLAEVFLKKKVEWNFQREVGKIDRNRMTSSIQTYVVHNNKFIYSNYTDMVYTVLFNMTAKKIRETRNIEKKSELTREYLTESELKLVDEAETIVTALTALGFKFDYIKHQLVNKYTQQLMIQ